MEYLCQCQVYKVEILQSWCATRTTHCDSSYDVTIATCSLPVLNLPKMINALFVAPEINTLSSACVVWCPYSLTPAELTTRSNNISWRRKTLILLFEWRGPAAHCVDISWNFVMSVTTVLSFSSIQKKLWEILNFLWFYIKLSNLHKSLNNSATKSAITIK